MNTSRLLFCWCGMSGIRRGTHILRMSNSGRGRNIGRETYDLFGLIFLWQWYQTCRAVPRKMFRLNEIRCLLNIQVVFISAAVRMVCKDIVTWVSILKFVRVPSKSLSLFKRSYLELACRRICHYNIFSKKQWCKNMWNYYFWRSSKRRS